MKLPVNATWSRFKLAIQQPPLFFFAPHQKPRPLFGLVSRHIDTNTNDFSKKLATSASAFSRHCFPDTPPPPFLPPRCHFFRSSLPRWQLAVAKISWLTFPTVSASITAQGAASAHTRSQRPPKVGHRNEKFERVLLRRKKSLSLGLGPETSKRVDYWTSPNMRQNRGCGDFSTLSSRFSQLLRLPLGTSHGAWSLRPTMWHKLKNPVTFPSRMLVARKFYDYAGKKKKKVVWRAPGRVWGCSAHKPEKQVEDSHRQHYHRIYKVELNCIAKLTRV